MSSYLAPEPHVLTADLPTQLLDLTGPYLRVRPTTVEPIGNHVLPATAETTDRFINWHSLPPARRTKDPALVVNTYGQGRVFYSTAPLFEGLLVRPTELYHIQQGARWPRRLIHRVLRWLLPNPRVAVDAPDTWSPLSSSNPAKAVSSSTCSTP